MVKQKHTNPEKKSSLKRTLVVVLPVVLLAVAIAGGTALFLYKVSKDSPVTLKNGLSYYDYYLNFSMIIPGDWQVANPDSEFIKEIVPKQTGGLLYDIRHHRLDREVVPITLVQHPDDPNIDKETKLSGARFMTMAIRPSDTNHSYLNDMMALGDQLKQMLESLNYSDVTIEEIIDTRYQPEGSLYDGMYGVVVHAKALVDGVWVNYTQYFEPAGANILIFTFGSTYGHDQQVKDIKTLTEYLVFHEGGQAWTPADREAFLAEGFPENQSSLTPLDPNQSVVMVEDESGGHWHADGTWHATGDDISGGHYHADGTWHPASVHSDEEDTSQLVFPPETNPSTPAWELLTDTDDIANATIDDVIGTDTSTSESSSGGHWHADGTWHPAAEHSDDEAPPGGHYHEDGSWHPDPEHSDDEEPYSGEYSNYRKPQEQDQAQD